MVEPLRHRQTKEAATDMFCLKPPRHISTLHLADKRTASTFVAYWTNNGQGEALGLNGSAANDPLRTSARVPNVTFLLIERRRSLRGRRGRTISRPHVCTGHWV